MIEEMDRLFIHISKPYGSNSEYKLLLFFFGVK